MNAINRLQVFFSSVARENIAYAYTPPLIDTIIRYPVTLIRRRTREVNYLDSGDFFSCPAVAALPIIISLFIFFTSYCLRRRNGKLYKGNAVIGRLIHLYAAE